MKKIFAGLALLTVGLWSVHAEVLGELGPAAFNFDAVTQATGFQQTGGKTNLTTTSTNITLVFKETTASSNFTSADLLALLANSFNTNFPAGSQIGMEAGNIYVVDVPGTNFVFNPSAVLSTTYEENFESVMETEIQSLNKKGFSFSGNDSVTLTGSVIFTYNDDTQTTKDTTHTNFELKGLFISKFSENLGTRKIKQTSTFEGTGGGPVRGVQTILTGTITVKASGIQAPI